MQYFRKEIAKILEDHKKWMRGESCGRRACLEGADLVGAYLRGAYLRRACLEGADLRGAYLEKIVAITRNCPEEGSFIAWKSNRDGDIIKLEIPAEAKRLTAIGSRKCRAEFVEVLEIRGADGKFKKECGGWKNPDFIYRSGDVVRPDSYNDDPRIECTNGIHFFISRQEAVEWAN